MIKVEKIESQEPIKVNVVTDAVIKKGFSPYIGENGNWYEYDEGTKEFIDTGVKAEAAVIDLANYYLKTEIYTQAEVNQLIGAISSMHFEKVDERPNVGESNVIYLVPNSKIQTENIYDEYIFINNAWEIIGNTEISLDGYAKEEWVKTQIKDFLTESEVKTLIPTKLSAFTNDVGYLIEHQDISGKQDKDTLEKDVKSFINSEYIQSMLTNAEGVEF
jgi:hypothetical protein